MSKVTKEQARAFLEACEMLEPLQRFREIFPGASLRYVENFETGETLGSPIQEDGDD